MGRKLDPKEYAMFRILFPGAGDEDIQTFKNIALRNREEAYQKSVDAVFQASISANRETYARLRKEDPDMYEALRDLMKDVLLRQRQEARKK